MEVNVNMDTGAAAYRRFLEGDDGGLEEIIAEYKGALILYLAGFCGDILTAEDLMEDVFVKLVVDKPVFKQKCSFKTWLFTIAGNVARDHLRRRRRRSFVPLENAQQLADDEDDLLRPYSQEENKLAVHRCLAKLNPTYRQVIFLSFFEDFSNEETARIMKKTKHQVENLLYRAKQSLREELRKEGFTYEE